MNTHEAKIVIETALLCAQQPLTVAELRKLFDDELGPDTIRTLLEDLRNDWQGRGVALVPLASGWRFQTAPAMAPFLDKLHPEKPPKYSRAVLETLAIIAYRQPVTRGEVEAVRGVNCDAVLGALLTRNLIHVTGRRQSPGRPVEYGTTPAFLELFSLKDLSELPDLPEPEALARLIEEAEANQELLEEGDANPDGANPEDLEPGGDRVEEGGGGPDPGGEGPAEREGDPGAGDEGGPDQGPDHR